jgi:Tfp pilus assembly protein PilF
MRKSVQLDPNQPEAWHNFALLQSNLGDKQSAVESFRKSIALDPEFAPSRAELGAVLVELGQLREAESQLRDSLRIRPAYAIAHAHLAHLLANRGDLAASIPHFDRAGDGAVNQLSYGITLARLNRIADACTHLEKSLQGDPNQPLAHAVLANLLESQNKIPEAIEHYREALRLQPNYGKAHLDLGALLARKGDRSSAVDHLRQAQSDPDPQIRQSATAALITLGAK